MAAQIVAAQTKKRRFEILTPNSKSRPNRDRPNRDQLMPYIILLNKDWLYNKKLEMQMVTIWDGHDLTRFGHDLELQVTILILCFVIVIRHEHV